MVKASLKQDGAEHNAKINILFAPDYFPDSS